MGTIYSQQVIIAFIIICVIMLLWSLWKRQLITMIVKVIVGMGIIWVVNLFLPSIAVGLNWMTAGITGILGIPGIAMLYVIQSLL